MTTTIPSRAILDNAEHAQCLAAGQAALRILPDTPEGIRSYLADLGCRGEVGTGKPCALTMYLRKSTGWDCDVHRTSVEWGTSDWSFTVKLSSVVEHFGWNYDAGDYPELCGHPTGGRCTEITAAELPGLAEMGV